MTSHLTIRSLGGCAFPSPLFLGAGGQSYVADDARVLERADISSSAYVARPPSFERAGPRERLYFDAGQMTAAILTAGGVCPGINDVVRAIVMELRHRYGVRRVLGLRYGFAGLGPDPRERSLELTTDAVRDLHMRGGTFLGTSRGILPTEVLVDSLIGRGIDVLFAIGGDGTMRAAHALDAELHERGAAISIVAVPKTIDNDIPFVDKTFGFDSAVAAARIAIDAAHAEARSVDRGIGLVRLMGRNAGFIAAQASIASHDVNACLVPEVPFELGGPRGLMSWLEERIERRRHAVIVIAEGCAKRLAGAAVGCDASGNDRFSGDAADAGRLLQRAIEGHFRAAERSIALKYIDPSYMIRAVRANAEDAVFSDALARNAVHAALAGKTDMMVGLWNGHFTHVALGDVLAAEKRLDPCGELWGQVLASSGQPSFLAPSLPPIAARRTG